MFAGCQAQANHLEPNLFPKDIALADLSDVMSKIADLATTACYPNGTSSNQRNDPPNLYHAGLAKAAGYG
jgi:hypothetical protein